MTKKSLRRQKKETGNNENARTQVDRTSPSTACAQTIALETNDHLRRCFAAPAFLDQKRKSSTLSRSLLSYRVDGWFSLQRLVFRADRSTTYGKISYMLLRLRL